MATANLSVFLRRLTRGMAAETLTDQSDRQLVEQFLARREEAAFEALLRRHGPMVYRVCWRVLQRVQDAEDAFQATFLVLAHKLSTVRKYDSLASWLHGVAHRTALKARAQAATRRCHEQQGTAPPRVSLDEVTWRELRTVLDEELARLPEKWRLPLILCYLEGRTQDEAAGQLGCSKNTLRRRLDEARTALGSRLSRRGVVWPAALSAALLSDCVASAALPAGLVGSTVEAAARLAVGQAAAAGVISAEVAALTEGVLNTMLMSKLKVAVVLLLAIGALGIGASALPHRTWAAEPPCSVSKSAVPRQDPGNLKETVLALQKRIWEANAKQDVTAMRNLLADDFSGLDKNGGPFDKGDELRYVSEWCEFDHSIREAKVILLNDSSALVVYEVHYKTRRTKSQEVYSTEARQGTGAWAKRNGQWWYSYKESHTVSAAKYSPLRLETGEWYIHREREPLKLILKKFNAENKPPKDK